MMRIDFFVALFYGVESMERKSDFDWLYVSILAEARRRLSEREFTLLMLSLESEGGFRFDEGVKHENR